MSQKAIFQQREMRCKVYRLLGRYNECLSNIMIWHRKDGFTMVLMLEHPDNEGPSITNASEYMAALIMKEYGLDFDCVKWFECYPGNRPFAVDQVQYMKVGTTLLHPDWKRLPDGTFEKLIASCFDMKFETDSIHLELPVPSSIFCIPADKDSLYNDDRHNRDYDGID